MLNSRKLFKALAVTGLLTLGSVASYAQSCTSFATNVGLRPEGVTETVGQINISGCSAPLPNTGYNVLIQLPANFTITNGSGALQQPTFSGTGTATVEYPAALPNAISISVASGGGTAFSVQGIRVNVANAVANGFATSGQVAASIIISSGSTIISTTNPNPVVGTVLPTTLTFSSIGGSDAAANTAAGTVYTCSPFSASIFGFFRFTETFAGGLRVKAEEDGGVAGSATTGTRVRILLSNVPAGTTILLPAATTTALQTGNNKLTLVSGLGAVDTTVGAPTYSLATGDVLWDVPSGGYAPTTGAEVVYEVTGSSVASVDKLNIPFIVKYTAGPAVGIGTASARGTLAPIDTTSFPRFVDVGQNANAFNTAICSTTLLFPYVTTDAGFDTGVAISNTTADTRNTAAQSGACSINAYGAYSSGATLPAAGTSPAISAGRTWAFSLTDSAVFPSGAKLGAGFNGYLIAVCDFQLAHGYAFVSTYGLSGANSVAQGYLALVIPGGARVSTTPGGAEQLNN